jgi:capsular polysaccharide export protein
MPATGTICCGASWWNRPTLGALLAAELGGPVDFVDRFGDALAEARRSGAALAVWASKLTGEEESAARAAGVPITRVEDGFVRSVGLGAGLTRGGAFVLDRTGVYYDATRPSDLEVLLATAEVEQSEAERAAALCESILAARLSKYNVGRRDADIGAPAGRERVLVVGQVSVDAGVRCTLSATIDVAGDSVNLDLLRRAREAHPGAFLIYKPHPDVAAGLRPGHIAPEDTARLADRVVPDADIVALIERCDRLVTLSSLSGFEAMLRRKPVTVHGLPFYAGWGLTDDLTSCPRRTRRRTRDELVALTLLRYCRTVDPVTLEPCPPEQLIARLGAQRRSLTHRIGAGLRRHASWAGRRLGL